MNPLIFIEVKEGTVYKRKFSFVLCWVFFVVVQVRTHISFHARALKSALFVGHFSTPDASSSALPRLLPPPPRPATTTTTTTVTVYRAALIRLGLFLDSFPLAAPISLLAMLPIQYQPGQEDHLLCRSTLFFFSAFLVFSACSRTPRRRARVQRHHGHGGVQHGPQPQHVRHVGCPGARRDDRRGPDVVSSVQHLQRAVRRALLLRRHHGAVHAW